MECSCHDYEQKVLNSEQILDIIKGSLDKKKPLSFTRFSHAEITYLNWNYNPKIVEKMEQFRLYNGADHKLEDISCLLEASLKETTITGLIPQAYTDIPTTSKAKKNGKYWYKLTKEFLHRLDHQPTTVCSVWSTQEMIYMEKFWEILKGNSIAIVGRRAKEAVEPFKSHGIHVSETMTLEGINQVDEVKSKLVNKNWDIAIISAGIPATILTPQLAKETGRIAIDFGHALDKVIDGDKFDFWYLLDKWKKGKHLK